VYRRNGDSFFSERQASRQSFETGDIRGSGCA
jgi:hypothetical protein